MRTLKHFMALVAIAASAASCGDVVRSSRAPVILVINTLQGSRGNTTPGTPSGFLISDVLTLVSTPAPCSTDNPCPTIFDDTGQAVLSIQLKDLGSNPTSPATPSFNNSVTITRVHVKFVRSDGRNVQGVDVPYEFDSATTGTVTGTATSQITFELVRHTAKKEPPLLALVSNNVIISTTAQITFYGTDAVGNEVSATGSMQVNFGNFGD
jgi:hypothetical protein